MVMATRKFNIIVPERIATLGIGGTAVLSTSSQDTISQCGVTSIAIGIRNPCGKESVSDTRLLM